MKPAAVAGAIGSLLSTVFAVPATAQMQPKPTAGFGAVYVDRELDPVTGAALHLGVAVDHRSGSFFVSATGQNGSGPHRIFVFAADGSPQGEFAQPAAHDVSSFGMRDLEFDGESLIGGSEAGLTVFGDDGQLRGQILAANGPQPVVQPIRGPVAALLPVFRAVALDKNGNQGNGSLLVADFGSPIYEIDFAGNILATYPNQGWSAYGLAIDPVTGNPWVHAGPQGKIEELDRGTMRPTGRYLEPVGSGAPGGLAVASPAASHHELWPNRAALVHLVQGSVDRYAVQRLHLYPSRAGWEELQLQVARQGAAFVAGVTPFWRGDVLEFRIDDPLRLRAGQPVWLVFNLLLDAAQQAYTDLSPLFPGAGMMWEQRSLHALSLPGTAAYHFTTAVVGGVASFRVPLGFPLSNGDLFRLQGMYLEPQSPQQAIAATNLGYWQANSGERGIVVAATGFTSFHAGHGPPFWSVRSDLTHFHGDILSVELSTLGAVGPAALQRFDIDQDGMNDRFDGGNSQLPGHRGTYRNGSAVSCGLDFAAPGVYVAPFHLPGESAGVAFTIPPDNAGYTRDLIFRFHTFQPGRSFEFDCDTDGGPPAGSDHAGMVVRVTTARSGVLAGMLQVDPSTPFRAVVWFP